MVTIKRLRVVNPRKRRSKAKARAPKTVSRKRPAIRRRKQRKNPIGEGVLTLMTNPRKRRRKSGRRRKSNPVAVFSKRRKNSSYKMTRSFRGRRRNPQIGGFDLGDTAALAAGALVGGIATRGLTQQILGANNTGAMGYGTNAVTAVALGILASKMGAPKSVASGIIAGGLSALFQRIWSEHVSQTSPAAPANGTSGLGDADYSANGLGDYVASSFPLPSVSSPVNNYQVVPGGNAALARTGTDVAPTSIARFGTRW